MTGGAQGGTQFALSVDLPTQSDKVYRLYAQPLSFGREVVIDLISGSSTIATAKAPFVLHDASQLIVGVVAERPGEIVGSLDLLPNQNNVAPLIVSFGPEDLPERVEAWNALDRIIWQDVDSTTLTPAQLDALRGWIAGGGRLVIAGGTAGPGSLSAFPDTLLPFRPDATTDVAPASLVAVLGEAPEGATDLPALSGTLIGGRILAEAGDRVIAAERSYGSGAVSIIGFDPTASWIADTNLADGLWRRLLPSRSAGGPVVGDDSQFVSAASQLPSLALPPVGGLIALLGAYILLIGPINYLVLRRLDRREWAWVTMPILIVAFAAGSYGFGSLLRGSELIINEVAIVRGAPGATDGIAQVYLGVFSPSRASYQLKVPGGALLSSPISGDFFGGDGTASSLDVLQGDPARVRNLSVGFGSLRTVRAETAVTVPLVEADLRLEDGRLRGTIKNASSEVLDEPAVVLGGTVALLEDLAAGATATVDTALAPFQFGQQLSDRIVGPVFFGDPTQLGDDAAKLYARHTIIDQLTYDPNFGSIGQLPAEGPVILAWADRDLLPVEIEGQEARRTGNVLYYLPTDMGISGTTTFRNDLLRSTVIDSDAAFFSKDPYSINFGEGSAELSYRPVAFEGTLEATELAIGLNFGGEPGLGIRAGAHRAAAGDPAAVRGRRRLPVRELRRAAGGRAVRSRGCGVEATAAPDRWIALRHRRPVPLRRPGERHRPHPVRERSARGRQLQRRSGHHGGHQVSAIVRTEGLVKRYDTTLAVAGIDLSVEPGEIFGLVGPNGAGKSTTLRILATLLRPSAGDAEIAGMSVTRNPDQVRRVIGFMPDVFGVYDDMKVWEYLDFFARCYGIKPAARRRMIGDLLELVDLGHKRDDYVQTLSRGMEQRLCLAHALVHDPQVLLLDEPASGLDPRARVELRELLRELRSLGKTILISSHILPELEELCTSVAIVDRGQVLAQGRVADIERRLRFGAVLRVKLLLEGEALEAARARFAADPDVASAVLLDDGTVELGFRGDDAASARLLAQSVAAGMPISSFARAASDLEELFLQVTAPDRQPLEAA